VADLSPGAGGSRAEVFPGPRPFTPGEAHLFFGRRREAQDLFDLAVSYRVLLLYSRSGAGKTSLVNAALIPQLEGFGFTPLQARVAGTLPPRALADAPGFNVHVFNALTTLLRQEISPEQAASGTLGGHFGAAAGEKAYYLIFDQFEEFFTRHPARWQDREGFFVQLNAALKENPSLLVLLAIREDYVSNLDPYGDHLPGGFRFRYRLERLRAKEAIDALTEPLRQAGLRFASDKLAEDLERDLSTEKVWTRGRRHDIAGEFVEPMHLQVVGRTLVGNLPEGTAVIDVRHVTTHARISEALARYYNAAIASAVAQYRQASGWGARAWTAVVKRRGAESRLRRWIERELITGSGTRAFAFAGDAERAGIPAPAISALSRERVLHVEQRAGADWVELSHDRFVDPVGEANAAWRAPRRAWIGGTVAAALLVASFAGGGWLLRQQRDAALVAAFQAETVKVAQKEQELAVVSAERNTAAATARGFETVLATRLQAWGSPPDETLVTPRDADWRLEADGRLEQMPVRDACGGLPVVFYVRSSPHPATRVKLADIWRRFGFRVEEDNARGIPQPMNAVWHGRAVPPVCWRAVACTLIRAGIAVRRIGEPVNDAEAKRLTIEVGYSGEAREDPPISVSQLWSMP
jgi:hypothetical protein